MNPYPFALYGLAHGDRHLLGRASSKRFALALCRKQPQLFLLLLAEPVAVPEREGRKDGLTWGSHANPRRMHTLHTPREDMNSSLSSPHTTFIGRDIGAGCRDTSARHRGAARASQPA